jgi:hypothetical protein
MTSPNTNIDEARGYKEFPKDIVSIFVNFEIAAQDYVRNHGKVSDKTLAKRIDTARREAFGAMEALLSAAKIEELKALEGCPPILVNTTIEQRIKELEKQ